MLKEGAVIKDVYKHVHSFVQGKSSTLGEAFVKSIGFAVSRTCMSAAFLTNLSQTGIEFRDSNYALGPKNARTLKENMVLVLLLGFNDLPDQKKQGQK